MRIKQSLIDNNHIIKYNNNIYCIEIRYGINLILRYLKSISLSQYGLYLKYCYEYSKNLDINKAYIEIICYYKIYKEFFGLLDDTGIFVRNNKNYIALDKFVYCLSCGFIWRNTLEGYEYWYTLEGNLSEKLLISISDDKRQ